ncbi:MULTISPECIES: hypothetical protein [Gordonia]|nr:MULTISPECIES: hypothetical protein [Gordonia]
MRTDPQRPALIEHRSPLIELVEITPPQTLQPARMHANTEE